MFYVYIKRKLSKHKKIFNLISKCKLIIIGLLYRFFLTIFSIFRIDNNKIIIISYAGKGYGDNGKYIVNELISNQNNKFKIYWATSEKFKNSLPKEVNYTKYGSISYLYHLATSKIWINNSRFTYGVKKRKDQYYIQTWHSSLRLKKIEKDTIESLNPQYVLTCKKDSKMIDLIISGCDFSTNIYKNAFWYNGKILNCGTPRCDLFFNKKTKEDLKKKIYNKYNIDKTKKIILYAPTFRKNTNETECYLNCESFAKKINKEYILLVRFHPISKYTINNSENLINVTNYEDMQELISISDFLITDYSGCCFDMMINNKPCILFTKDIESYLANERNLYFNFEDLPFPTVKNEKKLIELINNFNDKEYKSKVCQFEKKIGLCETGIASKTLVNHIKKVVKNEKI